MCFDLKFQLIRNPSIAGDLPMESSIPEEILCNELTNGVLTHVTRDIKAEFHYDTLREIEEMFRALIRAKSIAG